MTSKKWHFGPIQHHNYNANHQNKVFEEQKHARMTGWNICGTVWKNEKKRVLKQKWFFWVKSSRNFKNSI